MALIAIRMEQEDLDRLKAQAAQKRIPYTIYARSLIVAALEDREVKDRAGRLRQAFEKRIVRPGDPAADAAEDAGEVGSR
jgi:hypothetical protein